MKKNIHQTPYYNLFAEHSSFFDEKRMLFLSVEGSNESPQHNERDELGENIEESLEDDFDGVARKKKIPNTKLHVPEFNIIKSEPRKKLEKLIYGKEITPQDKGAPAPLTTSEIMKNPVMIETQDAFEGLEPLTLGVDPMVISDSEVTSENNNNVDFTASDIWKNSLKYSVSDLGNGIFDSGVNYEVPSVKLSESNNIDLLRHSLVVDAQSIVNDLDSEFFDEGAEMKYDDIIQIPNRKIAKSVLEEMFTIKNKQFFEIEEIGSGGMGTVLSVRPKNKNITVQELATLVEKSPVLKDILLAPDTEPLPLDNLITNDRSTFYVNIVEKFPDNFTVFSRGEEKFIKNVKLTEELFKALKKYPGEFVIPLPNFAVKVPKVKGESEEQKTNYEEKMNKYFSSFKRGSLKTYGKINVEYEENQHIPMIFMELENAQTMESHQRNNEQNRESVGYVNDSVAYFLSLVKSLQQFHTHQDEDGVVRALIHRDLKPENIFIEEGVSDKYNGKVKGAKPYDYGLALITNPEGKVLIPEHEQEGMLYGTPMFMSPEQIRAKAKNYSPAIDAYALGAIMFKHLAGEYYVNGRDPTMVLSKILKGTITSDDLSKRLQENNKIVGPELIEVIVGLLKNKKQERITLGKAEEILTKLVLGGGGKNKEIQSKSSEIVLDKLFGHEYKSKVYKKIDTLSHNASNIAKISKNQEVLMHNMASSEFIDSVNALIEKVKAPQFRKVLENLQGWVSEFNKTQDFSKKNAILEHIVLSLRSKNMDKFIKNMRKVLEGKKEEKYKKLTKWTNVLIASRKFMRRNIGKDFQLVDVDKEMEKAKNYINIAGTDEEKAEFNEHTQLLSKLDAFEQNAVISKDWEYFPMVMQAISSLAMSDNGIVKDMKESIDNNFSPFLSGTGKIQKCIQLLHNQIENEPNEVWTVAKMQKRILDLLVNFSSLDQTKRQKFLRKFDINAQKIEKGFQLKHENNEYVHEKNVIKPEIIHWLLCAPIHITKTLRSFHSAILESGKTTWSTMGKNYKKYADLFFEYHAKDEFEKLKNARKISIEEAKSVKNPLNRIKRKNIANRKFNSAKMNLYYQTLSKCNTPMDFMKLFEPLIMSDFNKRTEFIYEKNVDFNEARKRNTEYAIKQLIDNGQWARLSTYMRDIDLEMKEAKTPPKISISSNEKFNTGKKRNSSKPIHKKFKKNHVKFNFSQSSDTVNLKNDKINSNVVYQRNKKTKPLKNVRFRSQKELDSGVFRIGNLKKEKRKPIFKKFRKEG